MTKSLLLSVSLRVRSLPASNFVCTFGSPTMLTTLTCLPGSVLFSHLSPFLSQSIFHVSAKYSHQLQLPALSQAKLSQHFGGSSFLRCNKTRNDSPRILHYPPLVPPTLCPGRELSFHFVHPIFISTVNICYERLKKIQHFWGT